MSRRRRHALKSAARARSTRDKALRRRARGARSASSITAAAAVTLASVTAAFATPGNREADATRESAAVALAQCQTPPAPSSAPRELARLGDTLFFTADDGVHGRELWKSDGTEAGTVLVKNINPRDSARRPGSVPQNLTAVGDRLFFSATDGTRGRELWKSDGTKAGTVLVKNIAPTGSGTPRDLTTMGRRVFFTADDGNRGRELWRSNGTKEDTVLVKNISPERADYPGSYPDWLTVMGSRLFFSANDSTHGSELWRTNGRRVGTVLVKDIDANSRDDDPDYPGSNPSWLTTMGGRLFFGADDGIRGHELWRSDGSRLGTVIVKDIRPGRFSDGWPRSLTVMGDRLFFSADDGTRGEELWRSDGSGTGTVLVKDINPHPDSYYSGSDPTALTAAGNQLFFAAGDGTSGEQLWHSDGSRAGTVLVKTIELTDEREYVYGYSASLTPLGGRVFFGADDGTHGEELWTSDGTGEGTTLVKDISPCNEEAGERSKLHPSSLTVLGDRLFFAANDDTQGEELWVSDGTPGGTVLVKDIRPGITP